MVEMNETGSAARTLFGVLGATSRDCVFGSGALWAQLSPTGPLSRRSAHFHLAIPVLATTRVSCDCTLHHNMSDQTAPQPIPGMENSNVDPGAINGIPAADTNDISMTDAPAAVRLSFMRLNP